MKLKSRLFSSIAILIGTIIGAGIFGIPYAISKVGFGIGVIYLLVLGAVILVVTLAFGEVVLRTRGDHQMTGYAEKYLGVWGKRVLTFSLVFGIYGAMLAYTIAIGNFLYVLLGPFVGGSAVIYSMIFYAIASLAVLVGLGVVAKIEDLMVFLIFVLIGVVFIFSYQKIDFVNLGGFNLTYLFLPYGVILFAFEGASAIPDMVKNMAKQKNHKKVKLAIILGIVISFAVYLLFTLLVVSITGDHTTEESIVGLGKVLGEKIVIVCSILGIMTMTTSFLSLGMTLKGVFRLDYKMRNAWAWLLVCSVPIIFFLWGERSFIGVIDTVGAVMGGLQGILIILMFMVARKKGDSRPAYALRIPKFVLYSLMVVFGGGIIYQLYYVVLGEWLHLV